MDEQRLTWRERYRLLVSLLIIPFGITIFVHGISTGVQAWTLVVLGLAFVALGSVRLRAYAQTRGLRWKRRK